MDILIYYLPDYFIESRDQISHYIGCKNLDFYVFVTNIDNLRDLKAKTRELHSHWRQSGSPDDCFWVPKLYKICQGVLSKAPSRFISRKRSPGFIREGKKIAIGFSQIPKKVFHFRL